MEARITRDVILDLVPVYLAGEASEATKVLVDNFAKQDPYIKRLLESGDITQEIQTQNLQTPDMEMETLKHARSYVQRRAIFLALGIAGTILAVSLGWGGTFLAAGFWIVYFLRREKMNELLFK